MQISFYRSIFDGVTEAHPIEWKDFAEGIIDPGARLISESKEDAPLFNLCKFKSPEESTDLKMTDSGAVVRRTKENLLGYYALVLDYDSTKTLHQTRRSFERYEYCYYTSHNHMKFDPISKRNVQKYRIILPFEKFCPAEEFGKRSKAFKSFAVGADTSTTALSRPFYMPSCSEKMKRFAEAGWNKGKFLRWSDFEENPVIEYAPAPIQEELSAAKKLELISKLKLQSFDKNTIFVVGVGMKNCGFSGHEFEEVYLATRPHDADRKRAAEDWKNIQKSNYSQGIGVLINAAKGKHKRK